MDYIIVVILICIIGGAAFYVYKSKKNGATCIGCPHSKDCGGKCSCGDDKKE